MEPTVYQENLQICAQANGFAPSTLQPALEADIHAMERMLGRSLPSDYQIFLTEVGCGDVYGGLAKWLHLDISMPGNLMEASRELAREMAQATRGQKVNNNLPHDFLMIYDSCDGDVFGFAPADGDSYDERVYVCSTEDLIVEVSQPDFASFLDMLIEQDCGDSLDEEAFEEDDLSFLMANDF